MIYPAPFIVQVTNSPYFSTEYHHPSSRRPETLLYFTFAHRDLLPIFFLPGAHRNRQSAIAGRSRGYCTHHLPPQYPIAWPLLWHLTISRPQPSPLYPPAPTESWPAPIKASRMTSLYYRHNLYQHWPICVIYVLINNLCPLHVGHCCRQRRPLNS